MSTIPLTNDQLARRAPSIFTTAPHPTRSDKYQFISTIQVVDALRAQGFVPVRADQSDTRQADRRNHTRHLVVFRCPEPRTTTLLHAEAVPELILVNAHDGSSSYRLYIGFFRFVCANGLIISAGAVTAIRIAHLGAAVVPAVLTATTTLTRHVPQVCAQITQWQQIILSPDVQHACAAQALQLRYGPNPPLTPAALLQARRVADRRADVWTVYNRIQEHLLRGGLPVQRARRVGQRTLPIRAIPTVVALNVKLWDLATTVAQNPTDPTCLAPVN